MNRQSMIFYRSFYESLKGLEPQIKSEILDAIMEYGLNGNEIDLSGISNTVFILIKPQLQANIRRYENGSKPKRKREAESKQDQSKQETNDNDNVNGNVNDNVKKKQKFIPPSEEEVITFFVENNFKIEVARNAFHYYNDANWKDSRGKSIQNWKQKMRGVWFKDENRNVITSNKQVYTAPIKYRPA
jgi:hypothetical protein